MKSSPFGLTTEEVVLGRGTGEDVEDGLPQRGMPDVVPGEAFEQVLDGQEDVRQDDPLRLGQLERALQRRLAGHRAARGRQSRAPAPR